MVDKLLIKEIELFIKNQTNKLSPIHGFGHLKRTAIGAGWLASFFGESEEEQQIAYLAGLIHDLKRPPTEKIDHTRISIQEAEKVLEKFRIEKEIRKKTLSLVSSHRYPKKGLPYLQWVFLADKILEQSGAYLIFRRSYYGGECEDLKEMSFPEASFQLWRERMTKFPPEKFDKKVRKLADYQFSWQSEFVKAFSKKKLWALNLAKIFYNYGRMGKKNFEELIEDYQSKSPEDERIKKEALAYIKGKKFSEFKKMLVR